MTPFAVPGGGVSPALPEHKWSIKVYVRNQGMEMWKVPLLLCRVHTHSDNSLTHSQKNNWWCSWPTVWGWHLSRLTVSDQKVPLMQRSGDWNQYLQIHELGVLFWRRVSLTETSSIWKRKISDKSHLYLLLEVFDCFSGQKLFFYLISLFILICVCFCFCLPDVCLPFFFFVKKTPLSLRDLMAISLHLVAFWWDCCLCSPDSSPSLMTNSGCDWGPVNSKFLLWI